eukprot:9286129-Ditylum_brightwellii.AAC.1
MVALTVFLTHRQEIICGEQHSSDFLQLPQAFNTPFVPDGNTAPCAYFAAWAMPTGPHAVHHYRNNMR